MIRSRLPQDHVTLVNNTATGDLQQDSPRPSTSAAAAWFVLLQGAPYAYTPFCDTNKETEPYRSA
jgi:hypothetical protein